MTPVVGMYNQKGKEDSPVEVAKSAFLSVITSRGSVIALQSIQENVTDPLE